MNSLKMMIDDERIAMVCQCESNDTASEEVSRKNQGTRLRKLGTAWSHKNLRIMIRQNKVKR